MRLLLLPPVLAASLCLAQAPRAKAPETYWEGEWNLATDESDKVVARIDEGAIHIGETRRHDDAGRQMGTNLGEARKSR